MIRLILPVVLTILIFNVCGKTPKVQDGREVTFYPAYGYRDGTDWQINIRAWVHENSRAKAAEFLTKVAEGGIKCAGPEQETLKLRLADFFDKDLPGQQVEIQFDSDTDHEKYKLPESDLNGLAEKRLNLSAEKANALIASQGSSKGWLTYHAVNGNDGKGRIQLIDPEGVSVITDIDDTIKITEVPAAQATVLTNTFCRDFIAAPGMAEMYKGFGDVSFHYISGGPWQLFGPLQAYLVDGLGGYPEGTFHLSYFPKNILAKDTREILIEALAGSLEKTYNHKVKEITLLMQRFPHRKFILVGDSGEVDPEVYRRIRIEHPLQVQEIRIRDVVNDNEVNQNRLEGMNIVKAEIICATQDHYEKLRAMIKGLHQPAYLPNTLAPCIQQPNKIQAFARRLRHK